MRVTRARYESPTGPTLALIAVQSLCAAFFTADVLADGIEHGWPLFSDWEFVIELAAVLSLVAALIFEIHHLSQLLRRKAHLEQQLSLAAGAFQAIAEARFQTWALTPSEQDVAMFTLKGMTISEIAALRGSAEGTVKSHLNGIYRKAGASGRGAFLSLFIEDLMSAPPSAAAPGPAQKTPSPGTSPTQGA